VIWIFSADGRGGRAEIEGSIRGPRGPKKSETLHKGSLYINTTCVNSPGLNSTLLHIGTP
jgi:hypothetical protein